MDHEKAVKRLITLMAKYREAKFTGKTAFWVNWSQGGIASVEEEYRRTIK